MIPHCVDRRVMASRPAVKFRFTGTLPGERRAMFASAPPTEGGSRMPTFSRPAGRRANPAREQQRRRPARGRRSVAGRWRRPWRSGSSGGSRVRMNCACSRSPAGGAASSRRCRAPDRLARLRAAVASTAAARRRDGHRVGHALRPLPEEPAALEAEDAAPDAIEVHRDDRHVEARRRSARSRA